MTRGNETQGVTRFIIVLDENKDAYIRYRFHLLLLLLLFIIFFCKINLHVICIFCFTLFFVSNRPPSREEVVYVY